MLRPALEAFGAAREARVVLVWADERLAGLFPFERVPRYKGLPATALASWQHAHTLLCTPLVRADMARPCLEALFDWLDASLVEFRYVPAGEPFHRALREVLAAQGLESVVNHAYERGLLRKHRATISGKFRRQLARNERRLKNLAHVVLRPQDDIGRWIDDFLRIEASGWKGRNGSAMASNDANRRYFREIVTAAFRRGRLIGCGLDVGNVRQVDADPAVQWMDSFTEGNVLAVERLWPDRRGMQTLVAGVGAWGRVAAAALPWLRWIKRRMR